MDVYKATQPFTTDYAHLPENSAYINVVIEFVWDFKVHYIVNERCAINNSF